MKQMKTVFISCDYGKVFVTASKQARREKIIERAISYFQEKKGEKEITELPNLCYWSPVQWMVAYHDDMVFKDGNEGFWKGIETIEY
jgi:hypothetical protein